MTNIRVSDEARLYMVAEAVTKLAHFGCGRRNSTLQAIESAIDEGLLDVGEAQVERNLDGYQVDPLAREALQQLIIDGIRIPAIFGAAMEHRSSEPRGMLRRCAT